MRSLALCVVVACAPADARPPAPGAAMFGVESPDVAVLGVGDRFRLQPQFYDAGGTAITAGRATYSSSNQRIVDVGVEGRVVARAPGDAELRSQLGAATVTTHVRVARVAPDEVMIDVFPAAEKQRITGWEATGQLGEVDCDPRAYQVYHPLILDRMINELGITRLRLDARSGIESPTDRWTDFRAGRISYPQWRSTWMVAANDNADPLVATPSGFHWGHFDYQLDQVVVPAHRLMERRGEKLSVNLNYVDFWLGAGSKAFATMKDPEEYAELIRAVFDHMQERVGFVPDAVELNLEPEHTPYTGEDMGRALVAVARRLGQGGYTPAFIGPSTTKASNAPLYYDAMMRVPGAGGLVRELSYHAYSGVSDPTLRAIALRARRDSTNTAMLEHIGSGFDGLYRDLTVASVSAWQQFAVAYCGRTDNPENGGVYYQINQSDPARPRVSITNEAKLLRQVFMYVRPGAVRLGAVSSDPEVRPVAFRNVSGAQVVVGRTAHATALHVRGLAAGTYGVNYSSRAGAWNIDMPDVTVVTGETVRVRMPVAGAITIFGRPPAPRP